MDYVVVKWLHVISSTILFGASQLRMRDHALVAAGRNAELPRTHWRLFAWWVGLGFAGFFAFIAIFWPMVAKTTPFT